MAGMQVSFVGQTEEAARETAQKGGFADKVAVVKTSFKANSKVGVAMEIVRALKVKRFARNAPRNCTGVWQQSAQMQALAEKEGEGMAKMIYRKDSGEILGVHIMGLHAADLIHEASNAVATGQTVKVSDPPPPAAGMLSPSWPHCWPSAELRAAVRSTFCAGYQIQCACPPDAVRGPGRAVQAGPCRGFGPARAQARCQGDQDPRGSMNRCQGASKTVQKRSKICH